MKTRLIRKINSTYIDNPEFLVGLFGKIIANYIDKSHNCASYEEQIASDASWKAVDSIYELLTEEEISIIEEEVNDNFGK